MTEKTPEINEAPPVQLEDLNSRDFENPEMLLQLGVAAAMSLEKNGSATFVLDVDGTVNYVNPILVFISSKALQPPPGMVARRGKPILTSGRPQYVELGTDGTLYEVEYVKPDDDQQDHDKE